MSNTSQFLQLIKHPFKFKLYMLLKLPSAFFCGVRVVDADEKKCVVKVPFKWFSQNPFKSTYFACLSMAAEMSTGVLALAHIYKRQPSVSMLVLKVEGNFIKKATGLTIFTCDDGLLIKQTIEDAISNNFIFLIYAVRFCCNNFSFIATDGIFNSLFYKQAIIAGKYG